MVTIIEFMTSTSNIQGETQTRTQLNMRHDGKHVTLYCPEDKYSSVTFSVQIYHKYSTVAWLKGWEGPGGELPRNMRGYFDIKENKAEVLVLVPGDQKEYIIDEGKEQATGYGSLYEAWHDMDIDISLMTVLDLEGNDVTPDPDPVVSTAWTDFEKWVKDNQWTLISVMFLGGILFVAYLALRIKLGSVTAPAAAPAPIVVVK